MTGYRTAFFFFSFSFIQSAYCQNTMASGNTLAQDKTIPAKEKIYAHTDKSVYVAGEILWFKLYTVDAASNHLSGLSKIAYVEVIDSLGKQMAAAKTGLHNGTGNGSVLLSPSMSSGNYKLRAYTVWMKNGSPNDFYEKDITLINIQKLTLNERGKMEDKHSVPGPQNGTSSNSIERHNSDTLALTMTDEHPEYNKREKVTLSISASNLESGFDSAFLSLSVYRIDSLQPADEDRIEKHLFAEPQAGTDKNSRFVFAPEYSGSIITGKVLDRNGQSQAYASAYLSVPGKGTQFYPATSDANGDIRWETKDFYGSSQLVVQTKEDSGYIIRIDTPFSRSFSASPFPRFMLPYHCPNTLSEHSISMQVSHIYSESRLEQYELPVTDTLPFYATANKTYRLDDFTRFNTMEEVMREYVALANVTRRKGDFHLPVFNEATQKMFTDDPLVLLDGVPYFNLNRFMSLDPLKIRKLDVVFRRFFYGSAMFDGILNWQSYDGALAETSLEPNALVVDYDGLALRREFYSPSYETDVQRNSHLPDFRNVLYWNPDIILKDKQSLSFYTSDLPGTYIAVIQGISQSGKAGSRVIQFEVKK